MKWFLLVINNILTPKIVKKAQDRFMAKVLEDKTFLNGEIDEKEKPIIEDWLRVYEEEVSAFTQ